jgi:hypothetical protein
MRGFWPTVAAVGLLGGVLLEVATFLLARYGPSGGEGASWSFRGNGALVVPFGLGPALLAGGWTAIVLHDRRVRRWLRGGLFAAAAGAVLAVAAAVSVTLPDGAGVLGIQVFSLLLLAWMIVAPVLAGVWRFGPVAADPGPGRVQEHVIAGVLFLVGLVLGFVLASGVAPPGS